MASEISKEWADSLGAIDNFFATCKTNEYAAERQEISKLRLIPVTDENALESKIKRVRAILLVTLPVSGVRLGSNGRLLFEKEKENEPHSAKSKEHLMDASVVNLDPSASPFSTPDYARATVTLVGAKSNEFGGMDIKTKEKIIPNLPF